MPSMIGRSRPKVKTLRVNPRPETRFGAGILRALPNAGRMPYSDSDEAWYVANVVAANPENRRFDDLALESGQLDRVTSACCL